MKSQETTSPWRRFLTPGYLVQNVQEKGVFWCLKRVSQFVSLLPFALVLRALLLTLKPLVHIRFAQLWSTRIGVFALNPELYLCERDAGVHPPRTLDLWYHYDDAGFMLDQSFNPQDLVSNRQLDIMWRRHLHVSRQARTLDKLNGLLPGSKTFMVELSITQHDYEGYLGRYASHLTFTEEEEQRGILQAQKLGIEPGAKFICFHARDSAYLERARPRNVADYGDWSWQDLRDSSIENFTLMAEKFTDLGYLALRMGKFVDHPLQCENPRVIDYATHHQTDFLDLYLSARASMFVGQNSGMVAPAMAFRTPIVFVNVFPLGQIGLSLYKNGVCIPKKYYAAAYNRFLTFQEIFDLGIDRSVIRFPDYQRLYDDLGLSIVENTPEEICEAAMELRQRLEGSFEPTPGDLERQARFQSLIKSKSQVVPNWEKSPGIIMGSHFLKTNSELLD